MRDLPVWTVNQLAERIAAEFGERYEVYDEVKAEEAERKRTKRRLKVVKGEAALIRFAFAQWFDPGVLELLELSEMLGGLGRRNGGDCWLTLDEHKDR